MRLRRSAEAPRSPSNRDEVGRIQSAGLVMGVKGGGSSNYPPALPTLPTTSLISSRETSQYRSSVLLVCDCNPETLCLICTVVRTCSSSSRASSACGIFLITFSHSLKMALIVFLFRFRHVDVPAPALTSSARNLANGLISPSMLARSSPDR